MEFRIFLPRLCEEDRLWLSDEVYNKYNDALTRTETQLQRFTAGLWNTEERDDTYIIGMPYYGLKFRNDVKLELKIRSKTTSMVELWTKSKLGKKTLDFYKNEIIGKLSNAGYTNDEEHAARILHPEYFSVTKKRANTEINGVFIEFCTLYSKGSSRQWISFAAEGPEKGEIEAFILEQHRLINLWEPVFELAALIGDDARTQSLAFQHGLVPIISGYAHWVIHCKGTFANEETSIETLVVLDNFIRFLNETTATFSG
jgi:hypothetical protein